MSADHDPLWKRIWKTEGIRWLGPRGDGSIDAMDRFQHGFECGVRENDIKLIAWYYQARALADRMAQYANHEADCHFNEPGHPEADRCTCGLNELWRYFDPLKDGPPSPWQSVAKDLAEAGTAIVSELRRDKIPSPFVIGLFLEAAKAYDRVSDRMSEEGGA